jgi:high-affinity iron transporter
MRISEWRKGCFGELTDYCMLQAFIITLREGVEAALIVGITLAYLTKIGRPELRKTVYAALGAAFLGSIGVAIVIARLHLN